MHLASQLVQIDWSNVCILSYLLDMDMEQSTQLLPEDKGDVLSQDEMVGSEDSDNVDSLETCSCCVHKFATPCGVMIYGCSQSGKSSLTAEIILQRRHLFKNPPVSVIYIYSCWQQRFNQLQQVLGDDITFQTTIPSTDELEELYSTHSIHRLIIIDDKIQSFTKNNQDLLKLAAVTSHHCLYTVFYISQSIFHSQLLREVSLNCKYLFLFQNPRSQQQIRILGSQIFGPGQQDYFIDAFNKSVLARRYGYLVIDLDKDTPAKYRLKSCILSTEDLIVYLPLK